MRFWSAKLSAVLFVALLATGLAAQNRKIDTVRRLYVVAVHDSSLFTLCPPELRAALVSGDFRRLTKVFGYTSNDMFQFKRHRIWIKPYGMLHISFHTDPAAAIVHSSVGVPPPFLPDAAGILERPRPDWEGLARLAIGVCPSGWVDPGMRKEIEAEFNKKMDYELVDSPEQADVVLLVEGLYYSYWNPEGGGIHYNALDPFFAGRQLRDVAIAVAVPSEVYRRDPAYPEALLRSSLWAGASVCKGPSLLAFKGGMDPYLSARSASIKELMSQFFKRAKWDADIPPICPAWSVRAKGVADTDSGKGANITRDPGQKSSLPSEQTRAVPADNVIRTETVLVTVPLVASDVDGKYISDLAAEDFRLFEDGIEQKIDRLIDESTPIHTALIMDNSYSTAFVRADIDSAALKFLEALRPDDELMALSISNVISIDSEFTRDRGRLHSAIAHSAARSVTPYKQQGDTTNYMGTRLYDAVDLTVTERLNDITGRKAILLFTDGVDSGSRLATAPSTLARIEESGIPVYVVKYDTPLRKTRYRDANAAAAAAYARGAQYLQDLAARSGGRFLNASKGADLPFAFSLIAEELRHQYMLYYYPTDQRNDGAFRRINVVVDEPGVRVRARPGYRTASKTPVSK